MKMSNDDLKKITTIKQYLLDPPVSFKLKDYALTYLQDTIEILQKYIAAKDAILLFEEKKQFIQNNSLAQPALIKTLKETGIYLSKLTNR